jgi:hypothetical protein
MKTTTPNTEISDMRTPTPSPPVEVNILSSSRVLTGLLSQKPFEICSTMRKLMFSTFYVFPLRYKLQLILPFNNKGVFCPARSKGDVDNLEAF